MFLKKLQSILNEVAVLDYVSRKYKFLSHFSEMHGYNIICGYCFHNLSFVREPYLTTRSTYKSRWLHTIAVKLLCETYVIILN